MEGLLWNIWISYGFKGAFICFVCFYVYYHHIRPKRVKEGKRGHFISDKDINAINERVDDLEDTVQSEKENFQRHMNREQLEDIRIEQLDLGLKQMKDEVNKLYAHNDSIWNSIDGIRHDMKSDINEIRSDIKKMLIMMTKLNGNND